MAGDAANNKLGEYLRDRREKLDPAAFGFVAGRRRTPGLRREEVAALSNISPAWYTWLEQGRGGAASAEVLDRIARGMKLTEIEREHLFLLGLGHPPEARYRGEEEVLPRVQRLLDALPYTPAVLKTATWDVLAWNHAAAVVLADYGKTPPERRNVLRMLFCDPAVRDRQAAWQEVARGMVATFRIDAARAGAEAQIQPLVAELCECSEEFANLWRENHVQSFEGTVKRLIHPVAGRMELEHSSLAVDGRTDVSIVVFNPVAEWDREKLKGLIEGAAREK